MISQDPKTLAMIEKVVERRKEWELIRKEFALKYPTMAMHLTKDASMLSNYAIRSDLSSSTTSKKKRVSKADNQANTADKGFKSNGRVKTDGLTRKNRENTLDELVAEAGLG
jgi:hypothetical protein